MKKLLLVLAAAGAVMAASPVSSPTPYPYWACPPAWSPGPTVADGCVFVGPASLWTPPASAAPASMDPPATSTATPSQGTKPAELPLGLLIGFGLGAIGTVVVRKAAR